MMSDHESPKIDGVYVHEFRTDELLDGLKLKIKYLNDTISRLYSEVGHLKIENEGKGIPRLISERQKYLLAGMKMSDAIVSGKQGRDLIKTVDNFRNIVNEHQIPTTQ